MERFGFTCTPVEKTRDNKTGRFLYIYALMDGGEESTLETGENALYVYDLNKSCWVTGIKESGDKPYFSSVFMTASLYQDKIYYYGGYGGQTWVNFFSLDVKTHQWSKHSSHVDGRYGHVSAIIGEKMIIYGGITTEVTEKETKNSCVNFFDEYTFSTGEWLHNEKLTKTAPSERCFHSSCMIGKDKLYVYGGFGRKKGTSNYEALNDLWCLDNKSWCQIQTQGAFPSPKCFGGELFSAFGHILYLFGGSDGVKANKTCTAIDIETNRSYTGRISSLFYLDNPDLEIANVFGNGKVIGSQFYFLDGVDAPKLKKDSKQVFDIISALTVIGYKKRELFV